MRGFVRAAWLGSLGMVLLFLDFVSKAYVYHVLPFYDSCQGLSRVNIPVFTNWGGIDFMITLAMNRGAAWGTFSHFQVPLLIVRLGVIAGLLIYLFFFNRKPAMAPPLMLIIAGALGNVLDYFLYGSVVDFLHFNLWGYHFPVFNFADMCITIGVAWLIALNLFGPKPKKAHGI